MAFCTTCGLDIAEAQFCRRCGTVADAVRAAATPPPLPSAPPPLPPAQLNASSRQPRLTTLSATAGAVGILALALFVSYILTPSPKDASKTPRNETPQRPKSVPDPEQSTVVPPQPVTQVNPQDGLPYVWIPPGTFRMGCSPGDLACLPIQEKNVLHHLDERPVHDVKLSHGFWLGQTEVTQKAYLRVIGKNPSYYKGDDRPVEQESWIEANQYCKSIGGRLPTEAEWEYAARGGVSNSRYGKLAKIAWFDENSPSPVVNGSRLNPRPHSVGLLQPNRYGLYDMLGNVAEWTADWYEFALTSDDVDPTGPPTGVARVIRGGSWYSDADGVRASARSFHIPDDTTGATDKGFRCIGGMPPK